MSGSYDEYRRQIAGGAVGAPSEDSYEALKQKMSGGVPQKNNRDSSRRFLVDKKSHNESMIEKISTMAGNNKYVVVGVGIVIIVALALIINSVSIHHFGGQGFITPVGSPVGGQSSSSQFDTVDMVMTDGTKLSANYDPVGGLSLSYKANEGDMHFLIERLVYKNMVSYPEPLVELDVLGDGKIWTIPIKATGWEFGVPLSISKYDSAGNEVRDSYMVRLCSIGGKNWLKISRQSV